MLRSLLLFLLIILASWRTQAVAQAADEKIVREPDKTVYKKKTVIDFAFGASPARNNPH